MNLSLEPSATIIIPCRNERDNIEEVLSRILMFGKSQELIFVEGNSSDGTYEELLRIKAKYPKKNINVLKQPGQGKADAVHYACAQASGDILIILDADLTVPPEATAKCYQILQSGQGQFVNGSRLSLPMEPGAMPLMNRVGNKTAALFFTWLTGTKFEDTLCGLKGLFKKDYLQMRTACPGFGHRDPFSDFDFILGATALKLTIVQLPITYTCRKYGTSQISRFKDTFTLSRLCLSVALDKIFN